MYFGLSFAFWSLCLYSPGEFCNRSASAYKDRRAGRLRACAGAADMILHAGRHQVRQVTRVNVFSSQLVLTSRLKQVSNLTRVVASLRHFTWC